MCGGGLEPRPGSFLDHLFAPAPGKEMAFDRYLIKTAEDRRSDGSEDLSREFLFLFRRERTVEFFDVGVVDVIAGRSLIYAGD